MQDEQLREYQKHLSVERGNQKRISAELTPDQRAHHLISLLLLKGTGERYKYLGSIGMEIVTGLLGSNATPTERAKFYLILRAYVEEDLTAERLIKEVLSSFLDSKIR